MKFSVSLVIFVLLQHGLSAPTGRYPGQNPHSASHAGGPPPNPSPANASGQQGLPPLHEVLRPQNSPITDPGPSSSRQHHGPIQLLPPLNELVGRPIDLPRPPVQGPPRVINGPRCRRRKQQRENAADVGRYGCNSPDCAGRFFNNPSDYGRHITKAHSIPIDKKQALCKECDDLVDRLILTAHMKNHKIHIVDHRPHLPPSSHRTSRSSHRSQNIPITHPGPSSSHHGHIPLSNSGTSGTETLPHSHEHLRVHTPGSSQHEPAAAVNVAYTCSHPSCANTQVRGSNAYGRHITNVHSTRVTDTIAECNHCDEMVSKHTLTDHMHASHGISMVDA